MAKKKKAKSSKKVTKKTPVKKSKKKTSKKTAKKASAKSASKKVRKATKKTAKKVAVKKTSKSKPVKPTPIEIRAKKESKTPVTLSTQAELIAVKPAKKARKKRITKAETLRLMQKEQLVKKWQSLYKKLDTLDTAKYNMKNKFEEETAISHVKLGWGFILSNTNDRLEVLFEDGIKNLISNYKSL